MRKRTLEETVQSVISNKSLRESDDGMFPEEMIQELQEMERKLKFGKQRAEEILNDVSKQLKTVEQDPYSDKTWEDWKKMWPKVEDILDQMDDIPRFQNFLKQR